MPLAGLRSTVLAAASLAIAATAASDTVNAEYRELIERYARGQRGPAVQGLARFSDAELARLAQAVLATASAAQRGKSADAPLPLRAAAMLHLDLDDAERPEWGGTEQPRRCPGRQAEIAARYAALLAVSDDSRDFARRFFLALAHRCQWDACLTEAQRWAREGLKLFPRDAGLLLAAGSALEESATIWTGGPTAERPGMPARDREVALAAAMERSARYRQARSLFEEAIAADEGLAVARVHLGRVLWRLGEQEAARRMLEQVAARPAEPQAAHLAHLFLGRVHEDAGRLEAAVQQYRLALSLEPGAQAAAVALSYALRRAGDVAESRQVLRRALERAGQRAHREPYWDYLVGVAVDVTEQLDALREESLR
jgi:tetratricopeptide (TPR) repeat protein